AWYFLNNDVAQLLFFRRQRRRRGSNAACGQYPASCRARDGRFFCSCRALSLLCARQEPSDERPSSRFRGINSPTVRTVGSLFHGRPDPLPPLPESVLREPVRERETIREVARENRVRERLQQMEQEMVRDLQKEKTPGGD
ncbi:hypothetical protein, partial [Salmonella enterica]|uniref:hypothetical protein n=1 Tax=Salmonella enterica TaxID=28901 RepID=UPI003D2F6EA9